MKVLVTGFEAFGSELINPSQMLIEKLDQIDLLQFELSTSIVTLLLPVDFEKAWEVLNSKLQSEFFDFVLMLGQAGGRSDFQLERVALNLKRRVQNTTMAEVQMNLTAVVESITTKGEAAYISTLPLDLWVHQLKEISPRVSISLSAGDYVCNYIYYKLLESQKTKFPEGVGYSPSALFVHVPWLPQQAALRPAGAASMDFSEQFDLLLCLLKILALKA